MLLKLQPATLLDLVRNFIVFEKSKKEDAKTGLIQIQTVKKLAAYHQFFAVNKAVQSTVIASGENGDKRGGVVWHTQGSGKSLSMVFYSGKLITSPEMKNPTIVVITDRNDLDDQLFDTFASSVQLLRQEPVQAENREHLKELLKVASGGIVFTTIQKFLPENNKSVYDQLSDRKNVVVIADEAHRTQYGFEARLVDEKDKETKEVIGKRIAYGFAKYMRDALPNATYIGFTGTPIEGTDVNTPQVFGNYIDRYDIKDAVDDGATVKIFYESRLAKVNLDEEGRRLIEEFDKELEQDEELTEKQKAKAKWTKLEAIVGHHDRVKNLAKDIVTHFEKRQTVFEGKAMIVAMSRRIAADLYKEIIALRPDWHNDDLTKGAIKVVMTTNSADGPEISKHHTTKQQRKDLSERMKDPADELKLVIVRDMWLTGGGNTVTDIDGNTYQTVTIGGQIWMAENLKVTHYRNGDAIPYVSDATAWSTASGAYCYYDNLLSNANTYGNLYNWAAVNDSRNIAPAGWHVPTYNEWLTLMNNTGGYDYSGGKLKETGNAHWTAPNNASDEYGFTALPSGLRDQLGNYFAMGTHAYWWSSTEGDPVYSWGAAISYNETILYTVVYEKPLGFGVRCVKD